MLDAEFVGPTAGWPPLRDSQQRLHHPSSLPKISLATQQIATNADIYRKLVTLSRSLMFGQEFKILVADDSLIYTKLIQQTLLSDRHTLLFARNGVEAIDLFAEHQPSLVITDWMMPKVDGLELCRNIRSSFPQVHSVSFPEYAPTQNRGRMRHSGI
jgi:CheY-like chemotaxis protein